MAAERKKKPKVEKPQKAKKDKVAANQAKLPGNLPKDLADRLQKIPAKDFEDAMPVIKALVDQGPKAVAQLVAAVGQEFGDPQGVLPEYALHGMVHFASRPGAEALRRMIAEALARQLEAGHSVELRAFLCRQLQLCGQAQEVPPLARLLADELLCEPATQALCAIGTPEAAAAIAAALPGAQGKQRTTLINAVGRLRQLSAAEEVRKSTDATDADQRSVALYALSNMGDGASADALLKAAETGSPYQRSQAIDACLRLARRLGELGRTTEAESLLRRLADRSNGQAEAHVRSAILETRCKVLGAKAVPDVLAALESDHIRYRQPAASTAVDLARTIQKGHAAEADKVLRKVLEATKDEAVRRQAELLLSKGA